MINITVIIPVFNEEGNIGSLLRKIKSINELNLEIIVVNDGSSDNTLDEVKKYDCKIISLTENMGKGFAMREGIKNANGYYTLFRW